MFRKLKQVFQYHVEVWRYDMTACDRWLTAMTFFLFAAIVLGFLLIGFASAARAQQGAPAIAGVGCLDYASATTLAERIANKAPISAALLVGTTCSPLQPFAIDPAERATLKAVLGPFADLADDQWMVYEVQFSDGRTGYLFAYFLKSRGGYQPIGLAI